MREIKFRAWDDESKKLLSGEEIEDITVQYTEECEPLCHVARYYTGLSYGKLFVAYYNKRGDWEECTLMQFTGLLDKNGVPIYEGDVLRAGNKAPWVMSWFQHQWTKERQVRGTIRYYWFEVRDFNEDITGKFDDYEVVGNIYEHSYLLDNR